MINTVKNLLKGKVTIILLVIVTFIIGYKLGHRPQVTDGDHAMEMSSQKKDQTIWTCSMHPEIQKKEPGQCPLCSMDLIPAEIEYSDESDQERSLTLSETARKLAEIMVEPAERKFVTTEIRMTGKIDYDETLVKYIAIRFGGRLERLYVDYTGVSVKKGGHLVDIYSPELIIAQEELLQSLKVQRELKGKNSSLLSQTTKRTIESAREKLELWGLSRAQIKDIERRGKTMNRLTIFSPITGVVVEKNAIEGMYVKTGTNIYTIADLSRLWLKLDAYESDLIWLHYGQKVEFEVEAYPGELFYGRISFIDPVLNEETRTVKLRVNIENPDGKLKPGMFTRSIVRGILNSEGMIIDTELSGKFICPMHPEIVEEGSGSCSICGMPLVRAEDSGFTKPFMDQTPPLVIKSSAPLITGKRAIVYIQVPEEEKPTYSGREIMLGPRAGDYYLVRSGLEEGELVVVNGNFKIDSALQIMAKPSMMNPSGGDPEIPQHHH